MLNTLSNDNDNFLDAFDTKEEGKLVYKNTILFFVKGYNCTLQLLKYQHLSILSFIYKLKYQQLFYKQLEIVHK